MSQEELVRQDDAVIGAAIRRSLWALLILVVAGAIAAFVLRSKPVEPIARVTEISAPASTATTFEIPRVTFTDITREAGIDFIHDNGATGDKLLPETMGGGVAFFDYDGDGLPDLLFINGTSWPDAGNQNAAPPTMALYRNEGGRFTNTTAGSGLDISCYGMGVAIGDYDNDGRPDVFITAVGGNRLFRNLGGGKFTEVTESAGVGGDPEGWSTSAAFFDYDNDGLLDLFVCNYVRWSKEIDIEVGYSLDGIGRAYGPPMNFQGAFPSLYRNEGNGRFTDVSEAAGLQVANPSTGVPVAKSLGVSPVDLDGDGWIDLVVANDTVQNFVFHNRRDGTFAEIGVASGIAFDSYGNARGAMGIDTARYRDDDSLAVAIGNFANEMSAFYVARGGSLDFSDNAIAEGIGPASRRLLKFGIFFFDYDLDGRLDLLTVNGHLEQDINLVQKSQHYLQPAQLFHNTGDPEGAGFVEVSAEMAGPDLFKPISGRGSAFADIDLDGDLDVVLTQIAGPPILLRNDQQLGHHWLRLKLTGTESNRDAIGAIVTLKLGDRTLTRQVMPTRGYLSQSESVLTFGLGESAAIPSVEVRWPGAGVQTVQLPGIDRLVEIVQSR